MQKMFGFRDFKWVNILLHLTMFWPTDVPADERCATRYYTGYSNHILILKLYLGRLMEKWTWLLSTIHRDFGWVVCRENNLNDKHKNKHQKYTP